MRKRKTKTQTEKPEASFKTVGLPFKEEKGGRLPHGCLYAAPLPSNGSGAQRRKKQRPPFNLTATRTALNPGSGFTNH
ncbi:hypothetical protein SKAU_G00148510 [Synaphobranchus kaupii]|uniref:Uncharacterized protein n=1 Tax=Synaphobranchus kaupii TaxID=118154 RepID=A0A9Q1J544_SYNKA|nr:hypothetical protein SKAU_G00148510 [Synaphobranchus kaupii]